MFEKLYLASASPRRQELLQQLNVDFILLEQNFDETPLANESPQDYVKRLAIGKAQSAIQYFQHFKPQHHQQKSQKNLAYPTLGADTIVVLKGELLGKPQNLQEAKVMLSKLSGQTQQVLSSVAIIYQDEMVCDVSVTEVTFGNLSENQIEAYCQTGEPMGKAGAYAIQGFAASFVEDVKGSYTGVVGLPLYETSRLLQQMSVKHWLSH